MRRMGWYRKVGVVVRQFKNMPQVEFGVVAQSGAGIGGRMLAFGDPKFSAVKLVRLLACPINHAHKDHALVVLLGRNDEARAWFGFGMSVVREVAPDDVASRGFRPPTQQAFSISNRLLRMIPPLALSAAFFKLAELGFGQSTFIGLVLRQKFCGQLITRVTQTGGRTRTRRTTVPAALQDQNFLQT